MVGYKWLVHCFLAMLLSLGAGAQSWESGTYSLPETMPEGYEVDARALYDSITSLGNVGPPDVDRRQVERFAESNSFGLKSIFEEGNVYVGWREMESYLNELTHRVLPDSILKEHPIEVYPSTWTRKSAQAYFDGTILFNVGLIADVFTESELAFVLAHECIHVIKKDVEDRYFRRVDLRDPSNRGDEEYQMERLAEEAAYSRDVEFRADSIGALFAQTSGYDLEKAMTSFYKLKQDKEMYEEVEEQKEKYERTFKRVYKNEEGEDSTVSIDPKRREALLELFKSHPDLQKRIEAVRRIDQRKEAEGASFLQKERSEFLKIRKKARHETLHLLLKQGRFEECLVRAFRYHLQEPKDPIILEHLLKALRRRLYIDPELREKGFLHNYNTGSIEDSVPVLKNLHYLFRDTISYKSIRAEAYLKDEPPFSSNREAFHHFMKKADELMEAEHLFTGALYHHVFRRPKVRDSLLNLYLKREDPEYPEYARVLKKGTVRSSLSGSDSLLMVGKPNILHDTRFGYYRPHLERRNENVAFYNGLEELVQDEFPGLDPVYLPRMRKRSLNEYVSYTRFFERLSRFAEEVEDFGEGGSSGEKDGSKKKEDKEDLYFGEREEEDEENDEDEKKEDAEVKQEPRDLELLLLHPEDRALFRENDIASLEVLRVRGYNDRTKIATSVLQVINPWFYITSARRFYFAFLNGADRYWHKAVHIRYLPKANRWGRNEESSYYKATKNNLINASYYAIGDPRWE